MDSDTTVKREIVPEITELIDRAISRELGVDHHTKIINLLTKAYGAYKSAKSSRMILYIASQIANQYYTAGKYDMAKKYVLLFIHN